MKLACAYARCSTDEQAGSLPAQWQQLQAFAVREGYHIVERFEDEGVSGTSLDRPGLKSLVQAAGNGIEWQYVLVWDRSRLGRPEDPREAIAITYEIERHGKTIVPLHGTRQTGNPVMDTILEALEFGQAGEESIRKSRDVLRGQRESASRGSIANGRIPYGYDALHTLEGKPVRRVRYLGDNSKQLLSLDGQNILNRFGSDQRVGKLDNENLILVLGDSEKVAVVRRIFREYNSALSARSIAFGLNEDKIPAPRGGVWGRTTVLRVLENPAYKGTLAWNRQTWAKFHRVRANGQITRVSNPRKKWSMNPPSEWVTVEGNWQGIVTVSEWECANLRLRRPGKSPALRGKGAKSPFLASGLLKCTCGSHFTGCGFADKRNPKHRYEYYRCIGASERGRAICEAKRVRRDIVDGYIEHRIQERYLESAGSAALWQEIERQLDTALAKLNGSGPENGDRQKLKAVEEQIRRLVDAVATGALRLDEVESRLGPLRAEKAELEAGLKRKSTDDVRLVDPLVLRRKIVTACKEQLQQESELWPTASPEQRKQIVRAHVASLTVDYARHTIRAEFYPVLAPDTLGIGDTLC